MSKLPYGASTYSKSWVAFGHDAPLQVTHGHDWRVFDVNGNGYVDCIMGLGGIILGHRNPHIDNAIRDALSRGTAASLGHPSEDVAAERLLAHFPPDHMVQWGVNGSDATTGAVRLARLITGKERIAKWLCGYHGFHDWTVVDHPVRGHGVEKKFKTFSFGEDWVSQIDQWPQDRLDIAAIIVEPEIHPQHLKTLRKWCAENGALFIADEVMTWQRYPEWTASAHYDIAPDLWCLGKTLGNGMPTSAIVGSASMLKRFAPPSPNAFFSCTWAGHPLSMAAVIATLTVMEEQDGPRRLWKKANGLCAYLKEQVFDSAIGELVDEFSGPPFNRVTWKQQAVAREWRLLMREAGVLIYAAHNLSLAHDDNAIYRIVDGWKHVLQNANRMVLASKIDTPTAPGVMRR